MEWDLDGKKEENRSQKVEERNKRKKEDFSPRVEVLFSSI
jgi:hypothetical protein